MTDCRDAEHSTEASAQESMEEYLEVLKIMEEGGTNLVKISSVASHLGLAPPSVVQMLKKLSKSGYVSYQPRQGVSLTEKGRSVGTRILRNHRIMEAFVYQTVQVDLDGRVGCAIEHHMTEDFTSTLCSWLHHPRKCPHGHPIPLGECCKKLQNA
jgi:DtxR family Mn-dependent transcriptional regulator